jgi:hypothetical protein
MGNGELEVVGAAKDRLARHTRAKRNVDHRRCIGIRKERWDKGKKGTTVLQGLFVCFWRIRFRPRFVFQFRCILYNKVRGSATSPLGSYSRQKSAGNDRLKKKVLFKKSAALKPFFSDLFLS